MAAWTELDLDEVVEMVSGKEEESVGLAGPEAEHQLSGQQI